MQTNVLPQPSPSTAAGRFPTFRRVLASLANARTARLEGAPRAGLPEVGWSAVTRLR